MRKNIITFLLIATITSFTASGSVFAEEIQLEEIPIEEVQVEEVQIEEIPAGEIQLEENEIEENTVVDDDAKAERTIMMYTCGSDLETMYGMASYNLHQILQANFSADEEVRFIIMTGGSEQWQVNGSKGEDGSTEFDYLCDADGTPIAEVSSEYNQIWEAKGADADVNPGKMVLLDGDGITGTEVQSKDELMSDPATLKEFINYCVENYPAEKYDLILWDHGGGPLEGFAMDEHCNSSSGMVKDNFMSYAQIIDAIANNTVTKDGDKFDFINFDACLMNTVELTLGLADYMDYYIASPELEPGYGQPYTGWLDSLGQDPGRSAFDIGKQIVDEFVDFYDKGYEDGTRQEGTLAVIDINKLFGETNFVADLLEMNDILRSQALNNAFYDELASAKGSIQYGGSPYVDLGNLVGQISIAIKEIDGDADTNAYTDVATDLMQILSREDLFYAKGTERVRASGLFYRNAAGIVRIATPDLGTQMKTSGMYIYFPLTNKAPSEEYFDSVAAALPSLPGTDPRVSFLKDYICTMMDYGIILKTGRTVDNMISKGYAKESINYDTLKEYLSIPYLEGFPEFSTWNDEFIPVLDRRDGVADEQVNLDEDTLTWLKNLVQMQAGDAVTKSNISVSNIRKANGTGYLVTINDIHKRSINEVSVEMMAELPIAREYLDTLDEEMRAFLMEEATSITIGTREAERQITTGDVMDYTNWYNSSSGSWEIDPLEEKTYAIRDAEGKLHACEASRAEDGYLIGATIPSRKGDDKDELVILTFKDGKLSAIGFTDVMKDVSPSQLKEPITVTPVHAVTLLGIMDYYVPMSESFTISPENYLDIASVYTDISNIPDVGDTTGDGNAIHYKFVVNDIYGNKLDFSDRALDPEGELIDINLARIKPAIYNGENQTPEVVCQGKSLVEGVDYNLIKMRADDVYRETGDYLVMLEGIGDYIGFTPFPFKTFSIVDSEIIAYTLVAEARMLYEEADAAYREALASEETDLAAIKAAMLNLHNAGDALKEAEANLKRTRDVLSAEEQAQLADEIAQLNDEIEKLNDQVAELKVIDISNYAASLPKTSYQYTGKEIRPSVTVSGIGKDNYTVSYKNNKNIGTATVIITAKGDNYKGQITKTFKIVKAANPLKVSGLTAAVSYSKLKGKTQTLAVPQVIKFTKKLNDKKTYTLSSVTRGGKSFKKYFKVNKTTGRVAVKKGLKKGTYRVKVKIKAAGNAYYKASAVKTVTYIIKVK